MSGEVGAEEELAAREGEPPAEASDWSKAAGSDAADVADVVSSHNCVDGATHPRYGPAKKIKK